MNKIDRMIAAISGVETAIAQFGSEEIREQVGQLFLSLNLSNSNSSVGKRLIDYNDLQYAEVELAHVLFALPDTSGEAVLEFAAAHKVGLRTVRIWASQGVLSVVNGKLVKG